MTWDDLAKRILEMTDGERCQVVQFRESFDKLAETIPVDICEAKQDLLSPEGYVTIPKGDWFLQ